ncbi:MAG: hypothetical protein IJY20_01490 [Clostridia bacterium]|nr:hypothetical protein [Clostridia bacterium]
MSEAEKKRRADYKKNRKKWLTLFSALALVMLALTLLFTYVSYTLGRNYYIHYAEEGDVSYRVHLLENDFFEEDTLGEGQMYVASLVDRVSADFCYALRMDEAVNYRYSYRVDAVLEVAHIGTGKLIYAPVYPLIDEKTVSVDRASTDLLIRESVEIDYRSYHDMAERFVGPLALKGVTSRVVLRMTIDVISTCESFEDEHSRNSYAVSLQVPLSDQFVDVAMTSDVPSAESKILACTRGGNRPLFLGLSIGFGVLDVALFAFLAIFAYQTRNTDINYEIKVKRLVAKYKSYIQEITNPFDAEGYQLLMVKTFSEMLELRDTLQSPILMNENADKTCTRFLIPTNTKMLYVFEIKVDDYDELYAVVPVEEETFEEEYTEEETTEEEITEEETAEEETAEEETAEEETAEEEPTEEEAPEESTVV